MIRWLRQKRWKKDIVSDEEAWQVREDTPESHQAKQGTPSMGGIGIIGVACSVFTAVSSLFLLLNFANGMRIFRSTNDGLEYLLLPIVVVAHATLGFSDDWSKASGRGGLRARAKLLGQIILETGFLVVIVWLCSNSMSNGGEGAFFVGLTSNSFKFIVAFTTLLVLLIGTCNAVNLTDGIDGLATGLAIQVGFALCIVGLDDHSQVFCLCSLLDSSRWFMSWLSFLQQISGKSFYGRYG